MEPRITDGVWDLRLPLDGLSQQAAKLKHWLISCCVANADIDIKQYASYCGAVGEASLVGNVSSSYNNQNIPWLTVGKIPDSGKHHDHHDHL